jgi:hypothetical protein
MRAEVDRAGGQQQVAARLGSMGQRHPRIDRKSARVELHNDVTAALEGRGHGGHARV